MSGLQEGHPLAATGHRHTDMKPRGSRSLCMSASSARPLQGEGNGLTAKFPRCMCILMLNCTMQRPLLEAHLLTDREGTKSLKGPYLVGVGREEGERCSQAPLSSQQVGILAHLLGQKGAHGIWVHGLRELHGLAQDHHLLY